MKFSDIEQQGWDELKPYLDTCVLPVTGLSGAEQPWEATRALERLRDALDGLEIPYRGRIVTYPAMHYVTDGQGAAVLASVCARLKEAGFRFVVVISIHPEIGELNLAEADVVAVMDPNASSEQVKDFHRDVSRRVEALWRQA